MPLSRSKRIACASRAAPSPRSYTHSSTRWAVGAHSLNCAELPSTRTPSLRSRAALANIASSAPGSCAVVAFCTRPASSSCTSTSCEAISTRASRSASRREACSTTPGAMYLKRVASSAGTLPVNTSRSIAPSAPLTAASSVVTIWPRAEW